MRMTWRERLADWISGGALTFHKDGWERSSALYEDAISQLWDCRGDAGAADDGLIAALRDIAAMETPNANATVKRMARRAREALE